MSSTSDHTAAGGAIVAVRERAAAFVLPRRAVFAVRGFDAERYLHSRVTQDIKSLKVGSCASAFFLNAQGRGMTRVGFEYLLQKYVTSASQRCRSLRAQRISPHVLRHTPARSTSFRRQAT